MTKDKGNILSNHMGPSFNRLSPILRRVHTGSQNIEGLVKIERGNILANIICNIFRFPKASDACILKVECHHTPTDLLWIRNFSGHIMKSSFSRRRNNLIEKLGPLDLMFSATEKNGSLNYNFFSKKLFGIPIPKILSPNIYALEYESNGEYNFKVQVKMLLIGPVLSYGGIMKLIGDEK